MKIIHNSPVERKAIVTGQSMGTFTGEVYFHPAYADDTVAVSNVNFSPCARTNWHTHPGGQLLRVLVGSGWICDKGGEPQRIEVGDTIWCPPGTTHWHGAGDDSFMVHVAVSHGKVEWLHPVTDKEYNRGK